MVRGAPVGDADLVLEGGGVKGIGLVGAVSVLEERGYVFHRVAGTSAGAIVGSLLAAGVKSGELRTIMADVEYPKFRDGDFLDDHLGIIGQGIHVLLESGAYKGEYLREWLGSLLGDHEVHTFADLHVDDPNSSLPPGRRYRLVVNASDVSQGCLRRFPWDYDQYKCVADEVAVVDAVRASMSIPFFYRPVKLEHRDSGEKSWLVDGGMLSNFPVDVFDRTDGKPPRWPTFGIKLSSKPRADEPMINDVHDVLDLTRAMIGTMTSFFDRMHLDDPQVLARTIFVDTMGVKATDFDIDAKTQEQLYQNGRAAAERFLDGGDGHPAWNFEEYVAKFRT
jgi:NTE family protein